MEQFVLEMEQFNLEQKWVATIKEILEEAALKVTNISTTRFGVEITISKGFSLLLSNFNNIDYAQIACVNMSRVSFSRGVFSTVPTFFIKDENAKTDLRDWIWKCCYGLRRRYIILPHRLDLKIAVKLCYETRNGQPPEMCMVVEEYEQDASLPAFCSCFFDQESIAVGRAFIMRQTPEEVFWEYVTEKDSLLDSRINYDATSTERLYWVRQK
jgi:hypothetical protein